MQFTIKRIMFAVTSFAVPLALVGPYGPFGILAALLAGLGVGGLCIVLRTDQVWLAVRMTMFIFAGMFFGLVSVPPVDADDYLGRAINYAITGGIVGLVLSIVCKFFGTSENVQIESRNREDVG
jgi:hypothetical protein